MKRDKNNLDLGTENKDLKSLQAKWNEPRTRVDKKEVLETPVFNSQQKFMLEEIHRLLSSKETECYHKENFQMSYPISEVRDKLKMLLDML